MKDQYIMYGLLVVVLGVFILTLSQVVDVQGLIPSDSKEDMSYQPIETGTTGPGDVSITLTPVNNDPITIELSANTHSVDLSQYNLQKITTLHVEGKEFKPTESPTLRGHHVSGELVFDTSGESFTITIEGIPDVPQRTFTWR